MRQPIHQAHFKPSVHCSCYWNPYCCCHSQTASASSLWAESPWIRSFPCSNQLRVTVRAGGDLLAGLWVGKVHDYHSHDSAQRQEHKASFPFSLAFLSLSLSSFPLFVLLFILVELSLSFAQLSFLPLESIFGSVRDSVPSANMIGLAEIGI